MRKYLNLFIFIVSILIIFMIRGMFTVSVPMVMVTSMGSELKTVSNIGVSERKFAVLKAWNSVIRNSLYSGNLILFANPQEVSDYLNQDKANLAILPWYMVSKEMKILKFNNVDFWSDPYEYGLVVRKFGWGIKRFNEDKLVSIVIGGNTSIAKNAGAIIERTKDVNHLWKGIKNIFKNADLAFINLDCPVVFSYLKPESARLSMVNPNIWLD